MKGLSILFTVLLFVFAAILAQYLNRVGALPVQKSTHDNPNTASYSNRSFVNHHSNVPRNLN